MKRCRTKGVISLIHLETKIISALKMVSEIWTREESLKEKIKKKERKKSNYLNKGNDWLGGSN